MTIEIYILAIGFFLCAAYFMIVGFDKANKDIFIIAIGMTLLNILYCIVTYLGFTTPQPTPYIFYGAGASGSLMAFLYIVLIERLSGMILPKMKIIKAFVGVFPVFLILDALQSSLTGKYFYLTESNKHFSNPLLANTLGNLDISSLGLIIGGVTVLAILGSLIYILYGYKEFLREEKYLRLGIFVSLAVIVNDILIGAGDIPFLIPLVFVGYICETLRLSQYLYDYYKNQRSVMISHVKNNSNIELNSEYSRIFYHDLKGLIRKRNDELSEEFKDSVDRLINLYSPKSSSKSSLHEVIQTVIILFESNIEEKSVSLQIDLSDIKHVDDHLNINSNIICSILYGLLNNALDSVEGRNGRKKIELNVVKKSDYIKFEVKNDAPDLIIGKQTNLPKSANAETGRGNGLKLMNTLAKSQLMQITPHYENDILTMELLVPI